MQDTITISAPDEFGYRRVAIPGRPYEVVIEPIGDRPAGCIHVADKLSLARSGHLRSLDREEGELGERRNLERGVDPDVDALYDKLNRAWERVREEIVREALTALDGVLDGELAETLDGLRHNPAAGCNIGCPCSPGVTAGAPLRHGGRQVALRVALARPPAKHRLSRPAVQALRAAAAGRLVREEIRYPHRHYISGDPSTRVHPKTIDMLFRLDLIRTGERTGSKRLLATTEDGDNEVAARRP